MDSGGKRTAYIGVHSHAFGINIRGGVQAMEGRQEDEKCRDAGLSASSFRTYLPPFSFHVYF